MITINRACLVSRSLLLFQSATSFIFNSVRKNPPTFLAATPEALKIDVEHEKKPDVIVLDWECIANTLEYRIPLGIDAAYNVWPHLNEKIDSRDDDTIWLQNKLSALAHIFSSSSNNDNTSFSATCEYALATRLLLEEQALDQGESNGKHGKYASRFHPHGEWTGPSSIRSSKPSSSTRPLTVGEIAINWKPIIRDLVQLRYHCQYQDPLPILQAEIEGRIHAYNAPSLHPYAKATLSLPMHPFQRILLTVRHRSDWSMAQQSLDKVGISYRSALSVKQGMDHYSNDDYDGSRLVLLCLHGDSTVDILQQSPDNSTIMVVDSCWNRLEEDITLFGDYVPRQQKASKCVVPNRLLSLNLAEWCTHPTQNSAATMNPWVQVLQWSELEHFMRTDSFQ